MSKGAKTRAKELRKKRKSDRKTAARAKYEADRLAGKNTKSKQRHGGTAARARIAHGRRHALGPCGNVGCKTCSARFKAT